MYVLLCTGPDRVPYVPSFGSWAKKKCVSFASDVLGGIGSPFQNIICVADWPPLHLGQTRHLQPNRVVVWAAFPWAYERMWVPLCGSPRTLDMDSDSGRPGEGSMSCHCFTVDSFTWAWDAYEPRQFRQRF